jgi:hypothetical protein
MTKDARSSPDRRWLEPGALGDHHRIALVAQRTRKKQPGDRKHAVGRWVAENTLASADLVDGQPREVLAIASTDQPSDPPKWVSRVARAEAHIAHTAPGKQLRRVALETKRAPIKGRGGLGFGTSQAGHVAHWRAGPAAIDVGMATATARGACVVAAGDIAANKPRCHLPSLDRRPRRIPLVGQGAARGQGERCREKEANQGPKGEPSVYDGHIAEGRKAHAIERSARAGRRAMELAAIKRMQHTRTRSGKDGRAVACNPPQPPVRATDLARSNHVCSGHLPARRDSA